MVEGDRVRTLLFSPPHNDSLPGVSSVMDAMVSRGGVLSSLRESPNRSSVNMFKTIAAVAENPIGTTGLNKHATAQRQTSSDIRPSPLPGTRPLRPLPRPGIAAPRRAPVAGVPGRL